MEVLRKIWQYRVLVGTKFLTALGVLTLIWSIVDIFVPEDELSSGWRMGIIATILVFCIIYALVKLFRKPDTLELEINTRTKLTIEKGDMFSIAKDAVCVIPVNEYFDTHLGDNIVSSTTLHGIFLTRCQSEIPKIREEIVKQLSLIDEIPNGRKRTMVERLPEKRYPLGTCVRVTGTDMSYILVAVSRFNEHEHVDVATEEYPEVIRKMYNGIENLHDGKSVYIPLIGNGNSGYQLNEMQLLHTMVQAAYNADKLAITKGIHICIYEDKTWDKLNLNVIEYLFDRWKTLK